jgi:hypothetical protein
MKEWEKWELMNSTPIYNQFCQANLINLNNSMKKHGILLATEPQLVVINHLLLVNHLQTKKK